MSNVSSEGFDLAAYRAAQAEATYESFPVTLGERKDDEGNPVIDQVTIPPMRRWPIQAQSLFSSGDIVAGIGMLVGPEGEDLFRDYNWTFGEFEALFETLSKWSGFQMGRPSVPRPVLGPTPKSN